MKISMKTLGWCKVNINNNSIESMPRVIIKTIFPQLIENNMQNLYKGKIRAIRSYFFFYFFHHA